MLIIIYLCAFEFGLVGCTGTNKYGVTPETKIQQNFASTSIVLHSQLQASALMFILEWPLSQASQILLDKPTCSNMAFHSGRLHCVGKKSAFL